MVSRNHPDIYYPDGNLVICCKDKVKDKVGDPKCFRIHRSYLSSHSSVIEDMLALPSLTSSIDLYEGLPLVEFPVDVKDMSTFLKFFYQPWNDALNPEDSDIAFRLFEVLELADMLMIDRLKDYIISRIKQDWQPRLLQDWIMKTDFSRRAPGHRFPEPASVLRIARQFDRELASPLLFYELSFREPLTVYDSKDPQTKMRARWDLVSAKDQNKLGMWCVYILNRTIQLLREARPHISCFNKDDICESRWPNQFEKIYQAIIVGRDPLTALSSTLFDGDRGDWIDDEHYQPHFFCDKCACNWDSRIKVIQTTIFGELNHFYVGLN